MHPAVFCVVFTLAVSLKSAVAATTMNIGNSCGMAADCMHIHGAECKNSKCTCIEGLKMENDTCVIGGSCNVTEDCAKVRGSHCMGGNCLCNKNFKLNGKSCVLVTNALGNKCSTNDDCIINNTKEENIECQANKVCGCMQGFVENGTECTSTMKSASPGNAVFEYHIINLIALSICFKFLL